MTHDRPIRVCFMIDSLGVAGIEMQLLLLLKHLDRTRVTPYLCLLDGDDQKSRSLEPDNCRVVRLGVRHLRHPSTFFRALRLARFLRRERIDVLHPLFPDSMYLGAPVAKLAGVPCVVRFRVGLGYGMKPVDRWLCRVYNRLIDATLVNCEACRQAVIADENAPPESVTIIPNGLDLSRFSAIGANGCARRGAAGRRVGAVANLRPVKNLDLLVRAGAILAPLHPQVRLEIAGEGESRAELESLARELGLEGRVAFPGTVLDVPGFLADLDVAVLCSRSEGSPNAIME